MKGTPGMLDANPFAGSTGDDMGFEIVDFKYEKNNVLTPHSKPISCMKVNLTGDTVATASEDNFIKLTGVLSKKEMASIYNQGRVTLDMDLHRQAR